VLCNHSFAAYVDSRQITLCVFREQFSRYQTHSAPNKPLLPTEWSTQSNSQPVLGECFIQDNCDSDIDSIQTDSNSNADDALLERFI